MEQKFLAFGSLKETVADIMMSYKNTKVKDRSHDGDYVLQTLLDLMKENGYTLAKARSRRYPAKTITDVVYADDIALLANTHAQGRIPAE